MREEKRRKINLLRDVNCLGFGRKLYRNFDIIVGFDWRGCSTVDELGVVIWISSRTSENWFIDGSIR